MLEGSLSHDFQSQEALRQEVERLKNRVRTLAEDQRALESYFEASRLIVGIVELREGRLYSSMANHAARDLMGLPDQGRHSIDFTEVNIPENTLKMWIDRYEASFRQGQPLTWEDEEFREGKRKISSTTTHFAGVSAEGYPRFCYIAQDITERTDLIRRLSEQQIKLNTALDFGKLGIWEWNTESDRFYLSDTMNGVFGIQSPKDVSQVSFECLVEAIHPEDRKTFQRVFDENIITGTEYLIEFRALAQRTQAIWIQWRGKPVFDADGKCTHFIGTAQDISEFKFEKIRKQEETMRLTHLSKLSSLGEMASAMAHEINNPISIIRGYADLLLKKASEGKELPPCREVSEYASEIRTVCNRVSQIVNGLSLAARDGASDPMEVEDLSGIILDSLPFCSQRLEKYAIELRNDLSLAPLLVPCRSAQISQVFVNLLSNAIDAVKKNHPAWISVKSYVADQFAVLEITDSGSGIAPQTTEKIFQPFFTTKPVGEGLGIGLSISKRMVESHGGTLEWIGNRPGACFRLRLPLVAGRKK